MAPSTFPFLKLPGELRIKIYELVLGGHLLHVYKDTEPNRNKPTVFRCSKYRETWPCRQWGRKLDLALLRVCRQIYHEARTIPLTTNTFKFNEPDALKKFFLAMRIGQLKLIRSLQLEPTLLYRGEVRAWAKTQVVAFAFAGLK
ncbi:MAG: hypothetical protein M1830_000334, partial [Pleopsidium flavum]